MDDLHVAADGAFEFVLSAVRRKDYRGNWRMLPPPANYLLVRQIAYDWVHEVDGRIAIERLDRPAAKPRDSAADIHAALHRIPAWAEHWVKMSIGVGKGAKADRDGAYRLVIASTDAGVPNWLDTTGYTRGYFWGRLDRCDQRAEPTATKLKLAALRAHLPADPPQVSAQDRDAALRLRRQGAQLRHRW